MGGSAYFDTVAKILKHEHYDSDILATHGAEKYMEECIIELVARLLDTKKMRLKSLAGANDAKLAHYYGRIRELLRQRERIDREELRLTPALMRCFMEGDIPEAAARKADVVENAEEWAYIVKKSFETVNRVAPTFTEDCEFWNALHRRICGFRDLKCTEEFVYLSRSLETHGCIALKYTLDSLFEADGVFRLSRRFSAFYAEMALGCLEPFYCASEVGCDDGAYSAASAPSIDVGGVLGALERLRGTARQARVIRKSVHSLLNRLRWRMLNHNYGGQREHQYALLKAYDELSVYLSTRPEEDAGKLVNIPIEAVRGVSAYLWDAQQLAEGERLVRITANHIPTCKLVALSERTAIYQKRYASMLKDEHSGKDGDATATGTLCDSNIANEILLLVAKKFNLAAEGEAEQPPRNGAAEEVAFIRTAAEHIERYAEFMGYGAFLAATSETRSRWLGRLNLCLINSTGCEKPAAMLGQMEIVSLVESILAHYEDSVLLGSVKGIVGSIRKRIQEYLEGFVCSIGFVCALDTSSADSNAVAGTGVAKRSESFAANRITLTELDDTIAHVRLLSRINAYFNVPRIGEYSRTVDRVEPHYRAVKELHARYMALLLADPQMFRCEHAEDFFSGLVDLKWEYAADALESAELSALGEEMASLESQHCLYESTFEQFMSRHLAGICAAQQCFVADPEHYYEYFKHLDFAKDTVLASIARRMDRIAAGYLQSMVRMLEEGQCRPCSILIDAALFDRLIAVDSAFSAMPAELSQLASAYYDQLVLSVSEGNERLESLKSVLRETLNEILTGWFKECFNVEILSVDEVGSTCESYLVAVRKLLTYKRLAAYRGTPISTTLSISSLQLSTEMEDCRAKLVNRISERLGALSARIDACATIEGSLAPFAELGPAIQQFCAQARTLEALSISKEIAVIRGTLKLLRQCEEMLANPCDDKACDATSKLSELEPIVHQLIDKDLINDAGEFRTSDQDAAVNMKQQLSKQGKMLRKRYENFQASEDAYMAELSALSQQISLYSNAVAFLNRLLRHYQMQELEHTFAIDEQSGRATVVEEDGTVLDLAGENALFVRYNAALEELLARPLGSLREDEIDQSIVVALGEQPKRCCSVLLKDCLARIRSYRQALLFVPRAQGCPRYFDLGCTFGEFARGFEEEAATALVMQSKSDGEIREYLEGFCRDENGCCRWSPTLGQAVLNAHGFIANAESVLAAVAEGLAQHALVCKLNFYALYADELRAVGNSLAWDEMLIQTVNDIQPDALLLSRLNGNGAADEHPLGVDTEEVTRAIDEFKSAIAVLPGLARPSNGCFKAARERIHQSLLAARSQLMACKKSLNDGIENLRGTSSRLFFVSQQDILRIASDRAAVVGVLTEIFNITGVRIESGAIAGFEGGGEAVLFDEPVPLSLPAGAIINHFEQQMQRSLSKYFEERLACNSGKNTKISMIDELADVCRAFTGPALSPSAPQGCGRASAQLISILSNAHPDATKLYPKPTLADGELRVGHLPYRFEYYPPTSFIFTSATATIFSSIMLNYHRPGMILYGPSGTGKSESVKYFCRTLGAPLYTFCCAEKTEFASLRSIIMGCARLGSFVCFDEFNRLGREVMSAVADCICEYKASVKIFLTMNIGYQGRNELPRSLRALCGEVHVREADLKDIIQYYTGSTLLHSFITSLRARCADLQHYDFGLRAISMIMGDANCQELLPDTDGASTPAACSPSMLSSLMLFYLAGLSPGDRPALLDCLKEHFGLIVSPDDKQHSPCSLFAAALERRNGVLLYGASGSGVVDEYLSRFNSERIEPTSNGTDACDKHGGKSAATQLPRVFRYNPITILLASRGIFGSLDQSTGEWRDSVFLRDLRQSLQRVRAENYTGAPFWFLFDGPITPEWIEDFNSILDGGRVVCLGTGERIKVPEEFRFIFAADSLAHVTPATLTRVFLVHCPALSAPILRHRHCAADALDFSSAAEKDSRVVVIWGRRGVGKLQTLRAYFESNGVECTQLRADGSQTAQLLQHLTPCSSTSLYIDEFQSADCRVTEVVREFLRHGTIAGTHYRGLRIFCLFDCERFADIEASAAYVAAGTELSVLEVQEPQVPTLIAASLASCAAYASDASDTKSCDAPLSRDTMADTVHYLYQTHHWCIRSLNTFLMLLGLSDCTADALYFTYCAVFGAHEEVLKHLTDRLAVSIAPNYRFNPATLSCEVCDTDLGLSRLCFLLYCHYKGLVPPGLSLVIRGPRCSGKAWLLDQALALLGKAGVNANVLRVHWTHALDAPVRNTGDAEATPQHHCKVYLLCEKPPKLIADSSIVIELDPAHRVVDSVRILSEHCSTDDQRREDLPEKEKGLADNGSIQLLPPAQSREQAMLSIYDSYCHPSCCTHACSRFSSFYKYIDYQRLLKSIGSAFHAEGLARQAFLRRGVRMITDFSRESAALKEEIAKKQVDLQQGLQETGATIEQLRADEARIAHEDQQIRLKKEELNRGIAAAEEKKLVVDQKLQAVAPLLQESKDAIKNITKAHLSEIKVMGSPPAIIKKTIESVHLLLEGCCKTEWRELLLYIKRDDFISKVMNYDEKSVRSVPAGKDESLPIGDAAAGFTVERAEKASRACGALFRWVLACAEYQRVCRDVGPLQAEIKELAMLISSQSEQLRGEEEKLGQLVQRLEQHKEKQRLSSERLEALHGEIAAITRKAALLETAVSRLNEEVGKWSWVEYRCPVQHLESGEFLLGCSRNVYICEPDSSVAEEVLDRFRACAGSAYIELSMQDKELGRLLDQALVHGRSVIIRDVDRFDRRIYGYLKAQMAAADGDGASAGRNHKICRAIIVGRYRNFYEHETYEIQSAHAFSRLAASKSGGAEQNILELLGGCSLTNESVSCGFLEQILEEKQRLDDERAAARQSRARIEHLKGLSAAYSKISRDFKQRLKMGLSVRVFNEVCQKYEQSAGEQSPQECDPPGFAETPCVDTAKMKDFLAAFYELSFPGTAPLLSAASALDEVPRYSFDYTFVSAYSDVIFALKNVLAFDLELSAGSAENNRAIELLLAEAGSKLILVKNTHFLHPAAKTGTNRFIFVIDTNERHPLVENTRVVHYDRDCSFQFVLRSLGRLFARGLECNQQDEAAAVHSEQFLRLHALLVSRGMGFTLDDLEAALQNREISADYVKEVIYFNRMEHCQRQEVMKALDGLTLSE
ncbi:hypothetical protein PAPHI01_0194 [Pancytospora philotis]|nr:hypothetical protein PAPHI01_0194 [Pancytospora philotis]